MESGAPRLAGQRLRRARLRREASDRDDPVVAHLPDAGGRAQRPSRRRAATSSRGPEVRRADRRAVRRRRRRDHRRVERGAVRAAGPAGAAHREGPAAAVAAGLGRRVRPRVARRVEQSDPRARPADSRSDHVDRATQATTLQALELTNGAILTRWLSRGARRMLGELPPDPTSLYNRAVAGRNASASPFDDRHLRRSTRLWLIVEDTDRTCPKPCCRSGRRPSWSVRPASRRCPRSTPVDGSGLRTDSGPIRVGVAADEGGQWRPRQEPVGADLRHRRPRLHDAFAARSASRTRRSDIGSTLNPSTAVLRLRRRAEHGAAAPAARLDRHCRAPRP